LAARRVKSRPVASMGGRGAIIRGTTRIELEVLDEHRDHRLEFELEKARNGLAMPYDRERVGQLEAQVRETRQKLRMRKAKQMAAKLRLK
jgi:hypothetical protein